MGFLGPKVLDDRESPCVAVLCHSDTPLTFGVVFSYIINTLSSMVIAAIKSMSVIGLDLSIDV